jgi:hypothetical protein
MKCLLVTVRNPTDRNALEVSVARIAIENALRGLEREMESEITRRRLRGWVLLSLPS